MRGFFFKKEKKRKKKKKKRNGWMHGWMDEKKGKTPQKGVMMTICQDLWRQQSPIPLRFFLRCRPCWSQNNLALNRPRCYRFDGKMVKRVAAAAAAVAAVAVAVRAVARGPRAC
jgi:hypothetical protein